MISEKKVFHDFGTFSISGPILEKCGGTNIFQAATIDFPDGWSDPARGQVDAVHIPYAFFEGLQIYISGAVFYAGFGFCCQ